MIVHDRPPITPNESLQIPAIARCVDAWQSRFGAVIASGESKYTATAEAHAAFRQAMPPLNSPDNIRDFIACVVRAVLIGAVENDDASRLFYAAQVAQRAFPRPAAPSRSAS